MTIAAAEPDKEVLFIEALASNNLTEAKTLIGDVFSAQQQANPALTYVRFCTSYVPAAAEWNAPDTLKFLIDEGADINIDRHPDCRMRNHRGSFLQMALYYHAKQSATVLIVNGADLDARNHQSDTPLHCAVRSGLVDMITLMLQKGADVHTRNNDNESSYDLAYTKFPLRKIFDDHLQKQKAAGDARTKAAEEAHAAEIEKAVQTSAGPLKRDIPAPKVIRFSPPKGQ